MVEAVIALISTVIVFWLKRRIARETSRKKQLEEALSDVDQHIKDGDVDAVNKSLEHSLRRLQINNGNRLEQDSRKTAKR